MVGPPGREWKVLRETDGERFVGFKKGENFRRDFANANYEIDAKRSI
jgi:hypothetical protein